MSLTGLDCPSPAELSAVFAVDVNCQLLRKVTGVPQYVLFVLSMRCLGFLYTCTHAAPLLSQSRTERMYKVVYCWTIKGGSLFYC